MLEDIIMYFEYILAILMGTQIIYGFSIILLGEMMIGYYEWGYYEKPKNFLDKAQNVFMFSSIGAVCVIYKKLSNFPWIIRKLLFIIILGVVSIIFIIIFQILSGLLR